MSVYICGFSFKLILPSSSSWSTVLLQIPFFRLMRRSCWVTLERVRRREKNWKFLSKWNEEREYGIESLARHVLMSFFRSINRLYLIDDEFKNLFVTFFTRFKNWEFSFFFPFHIALKFVCAMAQISFMMNKWMNKKKMLYWNRLIDWLPGDPVLCLVAPDRTLITTDLYWTKTMWMLVVMFHILHFRPVCSTTCPYYCSLSVAGWCYFEPPK